MNLDQYTTPRTVQDIFDWYKSQRKNDHRPHLGGSQIGHPCKRALWYQFRHCDRAEFDGRVLRLFETGDREEARIVANLRAVGVTVWDRDPETGKQIRFTAHDGHFALSLDGVAEGLKESSQPHTLEFKTMNDKNFRSMEAKGCKETKPIYYAQCQIGMHLAGLKRCAFIAVNKNTDAIYMERLKLDPDYAWALLMKASEVIWTDTPPPKLSSDPSHFQCKWCDYNRVCHYGKLPEVNCRTCAHATPEKGGDGEWRCAKGCHFGTVCEYHVFNPHAMPWPVHDAGDGWVDYECDGGEIVRNGDGNSQSLHDEWVPF